MILAAYLVTGFLVASVYAVGMLRGRRDRHHRLGLLIPLTVACIAAPIQFAVGDTAARAIAEDQPIKFAAMECVQKTHTRRHRVHRRPLHRRTASRAGSGSRGSTRGWSASAPTPRSSASTRCRPTTGRRPTRMLHWAFDVMVGIGSALIVLAAWLRFAWLRRRDIPKTTWFLRAVAVSGVAAIVALECGWIVTEVGRQPWVVYKVMRTEDAVTGASGVWVTFSSRSRCTRRWAWPPCSILRAMARRWRERGRGGRRALRTAPSPSAGSPTRGCGMSSADAVAGVLWVGVTLYAVFAGADFGAGFWALVAGDGERGQRARELVDWAIGPVWEANHVWLIFVLVVLWTAFSDAFAIDLLDPVHPAQPGRARHRPAGLGLRLPADVRARLRGRRLATRLFGLSSLLTPFFMGTVVGAMASGRVPVGNAAGDPVTQLAEPGVSCWSGVLFVATCAYLSAVFLVSDARRAGDADLERYFTTRALAAALATGALAVAGIFVFRADARYVYDGLTHEGLPLRDPVRPVRARGARAAPARRPSRARPLAVGRGGGRGLGLGRGAVPLPPSADAHDRRRGSHERDAHRGADRVRRRGRPGAAVDRIALHARPAERDRGNRGPAGAMTTFTTTASEVEGLETIELRAPGEDGLTAAFAPGANLVLHSLTQGGRELLATNDGLRAYRERGATMGIPLLHPWANRLEVDLPENPRLVDRDHNGLPIHGALPGLLRWEVLGATADDDRACLRAQLLWDPAHEAFPIFPFPHRLEYDALLSERSIEITVTLTPTGEAAVPVSFGFHPYLRIPGGSRASAQVTLPVRQQLLHDSSMIPTGESVSFEPGTRSLGDTVWDDGFADLVPPGASWSATRNRRSRSPCCGAIPSRRCSRPRTATSCASSR